MAARKTPQEVAAENLETAERVLEKAQGRVETTKAAHEKAVADAAFAERKVKAARIMVLGDEPAAEIDPEPTPADTGDEKGDEIL